MNHKTNIILRLLDLMLVVLTAGSGLALIFVLVAPLVNTNTTTFFAFFALGAPVIYLVNLLLLGWWVARWRVWAFIPLAILSIGIWSIGQFIGIKWTTSYDHSSSSTMTVATYNTHGFESARQIMSGLNGLSCDVICLQEYSVTDSTALAAADIAFADYPYRAYFYNVAESLMNHAGSIILSKYPISNPKSMIFHGSYNGLIVCDITTPDDTIRLVACHLQTTAINAINNEQGVSQIIANDNSPLAFAALRKNFPLRAAQADSVSQIVANSPHPVFVMGDMNSPPKTYTYHTVRGDLADAFCEQGKGYGYTYKPLCGLFRIDHIFFDNDAYQCIDYQSPDWPYSDHNPVIAKLKKRI